MSEELRKKCSEQNKGSRLRLFLRSKGYYSIIIWSGQFLFNPLSPSSSLTFSALVRTLGGWFLWSTAPWLPCPLLSYFIWSVENRDISFFLSLLWFSVPLWLPCMTRMSSSRLPLQPLYDDGFWVLGSLSSFCCPFSYPCLWKSYQ